jgi:hypothetical protein
MVAHESTKETTMQTKSKKLLTISLAAIALTTASLAVTGEASAKGGSGGKGGGHFHGYHHSGVFFATSYVSPCWRWIGVKRVWVCY